MGERPHYRIVIDPLSGEEGGGFVATVPDLPGCMSDGETEFEAVQNVKDAISCWIEAAQENNRPVPSPSHLRRAAANYPHRLPPAHGSPVFAAVISP